MQANVTCIYFENGIVILHNSEETGTVGTAETHKPVERR